MSRVDVSTGDVVGPGTVLGAVGSEGNSTGPHLHFEVRRGGVPDDPMTFLAANGVDPGA
jgi:murein DD-endopeptidase MepM/ murein hydrolase activator NlpD